MGLLTSEFLCVCHWPIASLVSGCSWGILGQAEGMIMLNLSHAHSELDSLQALVEARRFGSGRSQ